MYDFIKKVLEFCQSQFDFSNEIHLSLLLGAYCSVTGERDWPNNDDEWLNMGFSSTDLKYRIAVRRADWVVVYIFPFCVFS